MTITKYEPENINGIMIMSTTEDGRYMLVSDYENTDNQIMSLCETISKLKNRVAEMGVLLAHQSASR